MTAMVKKTGRLQITAKNGRRYEFDLIINNNSLKTVAQTSDSESRDCHRYRKDKLQSHNNAPIEEPPNEPKKPPVKEPGEPPAPPPPPSHPPVQEPPNKPDEPPVKEPPPKDPDRRPPQKPPIKSGLDKENLKMI